MLRIAQVTKSFSQSEILHAVSIDVAAGELVALTGPSGSGKSTLLHIASGLLKPDSGTITFEGNNLHTLSSSDQDHFRSRKMGCVFQFHHHLPEFSAWENVAMRLLIQGKSEKIAKAESLSILELMGIAHKANALPSEMSGGEKQRAAIARAAVHKPAIIFADEPTGNLDAENAQNCLHLFETIQAEFQCSCIIATHDLSLASSLHTHYRLQDKQLCKIH